MSFINTLRSAWHRAFPALEFSPVSFSVDLRRMDEIYEHVHDSERLDVMAVFDALEDALALSDAGSFEKGEVSLVLDGEAGEAVADILHSTFAHQEVCFGDGIANIVEPMAGTARSVLEAMPSSLKSIVMIDRELGHSSAATIHSHARASAMTYLPLGPVGQVADVPELELADIA